MLEGSLYVLSPLLLIPSASWQLLHAHAIFQPVMRVDARTIEQGSRIEADVCIVGGGAAGISVALELLESDLRIVLLESGGAAYEEPSQNLNAGETIGHTYFPLISSRLRWLGGTTNHWGGYCRPLDPGDFAAKDWIPLSGWPVTAAEMAPWYERAREICQLGPARYEPDDDNGRTHPPFFATNTEKPRHGAPPGYLT
ncbi:MAG: FAD-dependent oxidoreductase [Myxococcota bacterium]|nr:FAD-dependent oxidoreductase [Myxococcota bacterium]